MKKNEDLLYGIGDVEDKYIESARPKEIQKRKKVWISAASAAACLICTIGLVYYFMINPIKDIKKGGGSDSKQITTQVSSSSDVSEEEQTELKEYPHIDNIEMNFGGDSVKEINDVYYNGEKIYMEVKEMVEAVNIGMPSGNVSLPLLFKTYNGFEVSDICYDDNYIYFLHGAQLYSISRSSNEIIAQTTNYFQSSLMHLGALSKCIGVDNSGYMYIYSYNGTENKNRILKYNCNLEIIEEYPVTSVYGSIPDYISDFDSLYIENSDTICCIQGNTNLKINIDTGIFSSDDNVLKDDDYMYVEDDDGQKSIITYYDTQDHSGQFEKTINCIDSKVNLSYEARDVLSFKIFDKTGKIITHTDGNEKFIKYRLPYNYKSFIKNAIKVDEKGNIKTLVKKEYDDGNANTVPVNYDTVSEEFSEINAEISLGSNKISDGSHTLYLQNDETYLYLSDEALFSLQNNNRVKLLDLPEIVSGYNEDDVNILKIDDNRFMFVVTGDISQAKMYCLIKE